MSKIVFYMQPHSRSGIVRWMLEEMGVAYDPIVVSYDEMRGSLFREINPIGKVPTIVHDGSIVTEAAAICVYLAESFPQSGLAPTADERADYYRSLFFAAGPAEAAMTDRFLGAQPTREQRQSIGYGSFADMVDVLEHATAARAYMAGRRFTAADVYAGGLIIMATAYGVLPERPSIRAYIERLTSRPAYKRSIELDDLASASATRFEDDRH